MKESKTKKWEDLIWIYSFIFYPFYWVGFLVGPAWLWFRSGMMDCLQITSKVNGEAKKVCNGSK